MRTITHAKNLQQYKSRKFRLVRYILDLFQAPTWLKIWKTWIQILDK